MITRIDDFFSKGCGRCARFATPDCSTRLWNTALVDLRKLCLVAGLTETVKWGHPCYMHAGRNIAILGAFRNDCTISFFHARLLRDPDKILQKAGPNTQHASVIRFAETGQVTAMAPSISACLTEAMGYAEAGIEPPKEKCQINLPGEMIDALDSDHDLAEAFHKLTPGRQRSYVINLASAKTSATKVTRITKFRNRILAGKGANEM